MKYLGSKQRIVSNILPIMLKAMHPDMAFCDLFCGGCNVISAVPKDIRRIASDKNRYLIAMLKRLTTTNWKPPMQITKDFYVKVRDSYHADDGKFDDATIGWIGFNGSRLGRFFDGGFSGTVKGRDYVREAIANISRQLKDLKGIEWQQGDYHQATIPPTSLLYLDPPYFGTTGYTASKDFDHNAFYDWCRQKKRDGHTVFVSEYNMPGDFSCIWSKTITNSVSLTKTTKPTERLWTL